MKRILLLFMLMSLFVTGCSPSRRLARLVERHPELLKVDTITVRDTVAVPEVRADTAVPLFVSREPRVVSRDSVMLEKGRLQVVVRRVHDTLFIRGKCKADTVVIRRKIPVTRFVVTAPRKPWVLWGVIALLIVMVFVIIIRR